jgi:hypothetical protein
MINKRFFVFLILKLSKTRFNENVKNAVAIFNSAPPFDLNFKINNRTEMKQL